MGWDRRAVQGRGFTRIHWQDKKLEFAPNTEFLAFISRHNDSGRSLWSSLQLDANSIGSTVTVALAYQVNLYLELRHVRVVTTAVVFCFIPLSSKRDASRRPEACYLCQFKLGDVTTVTITTGYVRRVMYITAMS